MKSNAPKILGGTGSVLTFMAPIMLLIYSVLALIEAIYYPKAIYWLSGQINAVMENLPLLWALFYFIGSILVLLGLYGLGSYYNDEGIKHNSLWWFIWWAVATTVAGYTITTLLSSTSNVTIPTLFIAGISLFLAIIIFTIISAIYLKRAYAALATRTGEDLFDTAAKLYWWGSLFAILLVGAFLVWISWVISAVAFFTKPQRPGVITQTTPPPPN